MMLSLVKKNIYSIKPYRISKEYIHTKLDANENPYNLLDILKEKFIENIDNLNINRYPDTNSDELRELLAEYVDVKKENILCGNGSDEIIQVIINTFVDKDEYVITHSPTFSMYKIFTNIAGGKILEVLSNSSFQINVDEIIKEAKFKKAKVIFLCNPNNPTGTVISKEEIERVIRKTEAIVVVDEAYYEFLGETVVDLVNVYDNLIVLRTLSKAFALAGARIGYGIASEKIMDVLYRVKPPYNLSTFSQEIGKLFIENVDLVKNYIQKIKEERLFLQKELKKIEYIEVFPTGSNFVLVRSEKAKRIVEEFKKEGLSIRDFTKEDLLRNCFRITVGTREESNRLLELFKKVV
ncbi:histidinol-phosphate transaminase [Crassaminicella thermophila]|uniref:Histidinol-phosphate aminotransferase n=2 Tax=Crassaminicella thermophila TaxID=2599308 RepID=A0A5C0SCJ0_CRATE|nr:histidinol-phosphate transaminase [Crassaminicella thermophila]